MEKFTKLSRAEMRQVLGGYMAPPPSTGTPGGNNGNPCAGGGCAQTCYSYSTSTDSYWGAGNCNQLSGVSGCHNYCCAAGSSTFWC